MIKFSNFSLRRGNKLLFSDVNCIIHKNQKVGLIGANGCGKSSLMSVIKNDLHADEGDFSMSDKLLVAHVLQETPALSTSALEYVKQGDGLWYQLSLEIKQADALHEHDKLAKLYAQLEAIDGYHIETRATKLLMGLGFHQDQLLESVSNFSGGWRMRLNLAQALICRSDVLLLDEPTNHLDLDTVIWLESWIKSYQGTLLLISHDRDFLDNICTHILHIHQQRIDAYTGNYTYFEKARYEKQVLQQSEHVKQQAQVKQLQQFIDRFRAQATKAKQVQSRIKSLEKMQQIAAVHEQSKFTFSFKPVGKIPSQLLKIEDVIAAYGSGENEKVILSNVNFILTPGSRIALLGENGAGKSTLVKLLAGLLKPKSGEVSFADNISVGYFAQHQLEQLDTNQTPYEFIQSLDKKATEQSVRNFLGSFAFSSSSIDNMADSQVSHFSGGEKARLVLAALVYQSPGLILLDEPTNHLDLEMREALSYALQAFQGAMVVVSHDRHLLNSISDEFYLVSEGKVSLFDGDLSDYRMYLSDKSKENNKKENNSNNELNDFSKNNINRKEQRQQEAQRRKKLQPLMKKIKSIETQMDKLSLNKELIEEQLANANIYNAENKTRLKELLLEQGTNNNSLDELEETWLDYHDQLEQFND
ncbi:MAG: ATP-binding cassette domain-containing protein [Pseudomonadota bacterium]